MSKIKSLGENLAVKPFIFEKEEKKVVRGLDLSTQLTAELISTEVVFDSKSFKSGDIVYFRNEARNHPATKVKLSLGGTEFILFQESMVVFVKRSAEELPG